MAQGPLLPVLTPSGNVPQQLNELYETLSPLDFGKSSLALYRTCTEHIQQKVTSERPLSVLCSCSSCNGRSRIQAAITTTT